MTEKIAKRKIIVITTGGTIEKSYDENDGLMINRRSIIDEVIIPKLRLPYTEIIVRSVLSKDSLYIDDEDRKTIQKGIENFQREGHPIIVSHGTDTMDQTVAFLEENMKEKKVPVIFTGAMVPMGLEKSDALQNFIEAMQAAFIVEPGLYLSFHNRLFAGPSFRKNRKLGTFENL